MIKGDTFKITVKANAPKTEMLGFDKQRKAYKIAVKAKPLEGKANREIINFFFRQLKKRVSVIKGLKSKEKVLKIA